MKNNRFQTRLREQKQYLRQNGFNRSFNEDGIYCDHLFEADSPSEKRWCDFKFIYGKRLISVAWRNLQLAYLDMVDDEFYANHHFPTDFMPFEDATPVFKKVGKSRKRVDFWVSNSPCCTTSQNVVLYYQEKDQAAFHSTCVARPSIDILQYTNSKCALITTNDVVKFEHDLVKIKDTVLLYLRERVFNPADKYDCHDYTRDNQNAESSVSESSVKTVVCGA